MAPASLPVTENSIPSECSCIQLMFANRLLCSSRSQIKLPRCNKHYILKSKSTHLFKKGVFVLSARLGN